MENSRKRQFISFEWFAVLSSMMNAPSVLLRPSWDVTHPSVRLLPVSHFVVISDVRSTVVVSQRLRPNNPYFTQSWPQSTRAVGLPAGMCQREAVTRFLSVKRRARDNKIERARSRDFHYTIWLQLFHFIIGYCRSSLTVPNL